MDQILVAEIRSADRSLQRAVLMSFSSGVEATDIATYKLGFKFEDAWDPI